MALSRAGKLTEWSMPFIALGGSTFLLGWFKSAHHVHSAMETELTSDSVTSIHWLVKPNLICLRLFTEFHLPQEEGKKSFPIKLSCAGKTWHFKWVPSPSMKESVDLVATTNRPWKEMVALGLTMRPQLASGRGRRTFPRLWSFSIFFPETFFQV